MTRGPVPGRAADATAAMDAPDDSGRRRWLAGVAALAGGALSGCVSIGPGDDAPSQSHLRLHDAGAAGVAARPLPLVPSLLIQAQPGDALAETASIAFSDAPQRFGFYQYAFWTERPVRQLPRLLQQRLEARRVAGAVGLTGDPLQADWLLTLRIDTIHHDVGAGTARLAMTAELFDRRARRRIASRAFDASAAVDEPASAAAAAAMARSVGQCFDALVPWLEAALAAAQPTSPAPA